MILSSPSTSPKRNTLSFETKVDEYLVSEGPGCRRVWDESYGRRVYCPKGPTTSRHTQVSEEGPPPLEDSTNTEVGPVRKREGLDFKEV